MVRRQAPPRWSLIGLTVCLLAWTQLSRANDYANAWGPAVGATLPVLQAPDQSGAPRNLENLAGEQGLLLFLSRSADW